MTFKSFAAPAVLAAAALVAVPAEAALPRVSHAAPVESASQYGPYVGIGGGWGWGGGHRGRHHRRGSSAGDVLTGVIILGTIAAVANAARRSEPRSYPDRYPYPDRRQDTRPDGPQGLEGAADLCLREVERDARAREVTRVERSASGWLVTGQMADGAAFSCSIGADGRIEGVDFGDRARSYGAADRQYGDDRYRSAREEADARTAVSGAAQPAYPGGPLPGEVQDEPGAEGGPED